MSMPNIGSETLLLIFGNIIPAKYRGDRVIANNNNPVLMTKAILAAKKLIEATIIIITPPIIDTIMAMLISAPFAYLTVLYMLGIFKLCIKVFDNPPSSITDCTLSVCDSVGVIAL
jgi:hypothetical protein